MPLRREEPCTDSGPLRSSGPVLRPISDPMSTRPSAPREPAMPAPPMDWTALIAADDMDALSEALALPPHGGLALAWMSGPGAALRGPPVVVDAIDPSAMEALAEGEPLTLACGGVLLKLAGSDGAWAALVCGPGDDAVASLARRVQPLRPFVANALEKERLR